MKQRIFSTLRTNLLMVCACMLLFPCLNSCKEDDDSEYEILEREENYAKFIYNEYRGMKGEMKNVKGWISLSPVYGWILSFDWRIDEEQLPQSLTDYQYYLLPNLQEEYQCYKDQYVIISGKYKYLYSTATFDIDFWFLEDFFEFKCTDIKPFNE